MKLLKSYMLLSAIGTIIELIEELADIEVPESFCGELECAVSSEDAEGKWYKGDKEICSSSKYSISSRRGRHILTVKDVAREDQGRYSFVVHDKKTSCNLKMKRKLICMKNYKVHPFVFSDMH